MLQFKYNLSGKGNGTLLISFYKASAFLVAIVTGSSSGIGAEIAVQFAQVMQLCSTVTTANFNRQQNGARVVITGRDAANLQEVADRIREVTEGAFTPLQVVGDLTEDEFPKKLIDTTISTFKRLDILGIKFYNYKYFTQ